MPTPDESMLNPMTDLLETAEQRETRLKAEQAMKELLAALPMKESLLAGRKGRR